jgi:hypothetical protein
VVDLVLASLIVIGGYNAVVGRQLGLPHSELAEFLPRLLLAFGAAHFSLVFLGLFIDLENALNVVALNLASTSMFTNIITALFQGNLAGEGLLLWVLTLVLGVMAILLGAQMAVRLALLWVLLVLSGPGLALCWLRETSVHRKRRISRTGVPSSQHSQVASTRDLFIKDHSSKLSTARPLRRLFTDEIL